MRKFIIYIKVKGVISSIEWVFCLKFIKENS